MAVRWSVLPYMPNAQASTYGGLPGTTVSFYASGFARQEVVHVYIGHAQNNTGNMVSCFLTDDRGNAVAAGSYVVPAAVVEDMYGPDVRARTNMGTMTVAGQ